jgi:outer membrane receptor protein involved in Fe transport
LGISVVVQSQSWWSVGGELEYTEGFLKETQENAVQGSAFLSATLPRGKHYDYEVDASLLGFFVAADHAFSEKATISGALRFQYTKYKYDNKMIDGRTKEDGTNCGFGGCRFSRPSDREDSFSTVSPNIGFIYEFNQNSQAYASISRGFRAPQTTELYRLQNGQEVADINEVEMDSIEVGFRNQGTWGNYAISAFAMRKDNFIFRDTQRQNVDSGETSHRGIELALNYQFNSSISASTSFTYAKHKYENNPGLSREDVNGKIVDTAPKTLGSSRFKWEPIDALGLELEWVHIGSYFQDPANKNKYEGHDLLHLRVELDIGRGDSRVFAQVKNLGDKDYAERADFAFGSHRYFVGTPRSVFVGFRKSF